MVRCNCKTAKGDQCKKEAQEGSKKCFIHKKCKTQVSAKKAKSKASQKSKIPVKKTAKTKVAAKGKSPVWIKSKAWESPVPEWMKGGEKIKTKPLTPQNADPWWLM